MTKYVKGFKFRIYPKPEHVDLLARSFGHSRFVYNQLLGKAISDYEKYKEDNTSLKPKLGIYDLSNQLPQLKKEFPWLNEVSSVALQQKAIHLSKAFSSFFKNLKKGNITFPKFKKKSNRKSFTLMKKAFKIENDHLIIPKSNLPIKINWSRRLPSTPSSCTISQDPDGKYYVSFTCEYDPQLTNGSNQIGIDLGISTFVTLSNGEVTHNPNYLKKSLKRLKKVQQNLCRREKGSKNREKSRIIVAREHKQITNQRNDFLHKLSRKLVNENQVISIESLNVKGMVKNRTLARSISDVSWGRFVELLTYKARESHHCSITMMHPFYPSSKLCSTCGTKYKELKLHERKWTCKSCNTTHNRDHNASINILQKGLETLKTWAPNGEWVNAPIICDNEH